MEKYRGRLSFDNIEAFLEDPQSAKEAEKIAKLVRFKKVISSPKLNIPKDFQRALFSFANIGREFYWDIHNTSFVTKEMLDCFDELCPKMKFLYFGGRMEFVLSRALSKGIVDKSALADSFVVKYLKKKLAPHLYYSIDEMRMILMEIGKIESRINPNWTDKQKVMFIYDWIRSSIEYDSNFAQADKQKLNGVGVGNLCNRSLRGLNSKTTVCVGYSMIFRELLIRQGIECTISNGNAHAYNVVTLGGINYYLDITKDGSLLRTFDDMSKSNSIGVGNEEFFKSPTHQPIFVAPFDGRIPEYQPFNFNEAEQIRRKVCCVRDYTGFAVMMAKTQNENKYVIIQTNANKAGVAFYIYQQYPIEKNEPKVLLSTFHVARYKRKGINETVKRIFSPDRSEECLTNYGGDLGNIVKAEGEGNKYYLEDGQLKEFIPQTFNFIRNDNSKVLVVEKGSERVGNHTLYKYEVFDLNLIPKHLTCIGYSVLLDEPIRKEHQEDKLLSSFMANEFFSRANLDNAAKFHSGYLGGIIPYQDTDEFCMIKDIELDSYFDSSEKEISQT